MAAIKYFLRVQDLKDRGYIQGNVEEIVLASIMQRVQDMDLQPILGTPLYNKLLSELPNPTGIYLTIIDEHITPALVALCEVRAVVHLNYKLRNKSVGTMNDQFVRDGTAKEMDDLRVQLEKDAAFYMNRLIAFLKQNKTSIPEYTEDPETGDFKPESKTTASRIRII